MPDITIRLLTAADAEAFYALRLQGLQECPQAFGTSAEEFAATPLEEVRQRFAASPHSIVVGAFVAGSDGNQLVGTVGCLRESQEKTRHRAFIWGVYIRPEWRGQGIARALMEKVIATVRSWPGVEQIHLAVAIPNPAACRLYDALGFTAYGVEPRALRVGDRYVDEELRVLILQ